MTKIPTITEVAHRLARRCAEHGEWIPSELWSRYHRACRAARLDCEALYFAARAQVEAEEA